ncbi:UNVERIFIED_ORG: hypothetical protein ABIC97_005456 [Peribacillus simplex]
MHDTWIYRHFINTTFFPVLVIGILIIITIFIYFVSKSKNNT